MLITAIVFALFISFIEIYLAIKIPALRSFLRKHPVFSIAVSLLTSFTLAGLFAVSGLIVAMAAVMAIVFTMFFHLATKKFDEATKTASNQQTQVQQRVNEVKTDASAAKPGLVIILKVLMFPLWITWKILVFLLKTIGRINNQPATA